MASHLEHQLAGLQINHSESGDSGPGNASPSFQGSPSRKVGPAVPPKPSKKATPLVILLYSSLNLSLKLSFYLLTKSIVFRFRKVIPSMGLVNLHIVFHCKVEDQQVQINQVFPCTQIYLTVKALVIFDSRNISLINLLFNFIVFQKRNKADYLPFIFQE